MTSSASESNIGSTVSAPARLLSDSKIRNSSGNSADGTITRKQARPAKERSGLELAEHFGLPIEQLPSCFQYRPRYSYILPRAPSYTFGVRHSMLKLEPMGAQDSTHYAYQTPHELKRYFSK